MSYSLQDEIRREQLDIGMTFALAAASVERERGNKQLSDFDRQAKRKAAEILEQAARGEKFCRTGTVAHESSLMMTDIDRLSAVNPALRQYSPTGVESVGTDVLDFLRIFADRLEKPASELSEPDARELDAFLHFMADKLHAFVSSGIPFYVTEEASYSG